MKNFLIFFLLVSNFILSQNHYEIMDLKSSLQVDNYCNKIFNDKSLRETIIDGEIKDISNHINVGGFGIQIFKIDNDIKRILKEESMKNKSETIDCYFQNKKLVKVVFKDFIYDDKILKNVLMGHYYFYDGKIYKFFGKDFDNQKMNNKIEELLEYLK